ncbi:Catechol 2,3-dioxygenase [Albimonas donghaensis]|uniref:Catechol 2,3-dioxygenase n=1 Tax=Albimonas donghaensis TaxID=356660 RepID=A0A1H2XD03_9RHOB|nr:VOC family protein [Albimonas donghaensis]SDW90334.1 Catechol 2,3-dioxygenase [Albimonas donghaensis]
MAPETPRMMWGHININVSDLDRARAFYALLGFTEYRAGIPYLGLEDGAEPRPLPPQCAEALGVPPGATGRACILELGGGYPKLDLTEFRGLAARPPLETSDLGVARICLGTRDLAAEHARLSAAGVAFVSPPRECPEGMAKIALARDPDGTLIELIEVVRDRWPAP